MLLNGHTGLKCFWLQRINSSFSKVARPALSHVDVSHPLWRVTVGQKGASIHQWPNGTTLVMCLASVPFFFLDLYRQDVSLACWIPLPCPS